MNLSQRFGNFFSSSIQHKLVVVITVVVTIVLGGFGVYFVNSQRQDALSELGARATRTTKLLAETLSLPLWNVDRGALDTQITAVMTDPDVNSVAIYEKGKSVALVQTRKPANAIDPIQREAEIVFARGAEQIVLGKVEIIYTRETVYRSLVQTQWLIFGIVISLTAFLVISIYYSVGRFVINPLSEITKLTSRFSQGHYDARALKVSQDEVGILSDAFNQMAGQVKYLIESLESRVEERTSELKQRSETLELVSKRMEKRASQLQAVALVGKAITSIQDLEDLLYRIALTISEQFGFYHIGIFLIDDNQEFAVLRASNSEGGRKMLEREHKLKIGQVGIVGYVANMGRPRIALDTGADAVFFNNPDLPATRSEMALPLRVRTDLIGVLDIQSEKASAFSEEDIEVLTIVADQVSIAIQNAQRFEEAQSALAQSRKIYQEYIRREWKSTISGQKIVGYRYTDTGIEPLKDTIAPAVNRPQHTKKLEAVLEIPIVLQGEVIGTVMAKSRDFPEWQEDDVDIIKAAADRVALALENARLLESSQDMAARERAISDISSKIVSAVNLKSVLQVAVSELGQILPSSEVVVQLVSKDESNQD
jgi:GAF domain-containing protein/HAMP domain-containing protein